MDKNKKSIGFWHDFDHCKEVAEKCSSKSEFHDKYRSAYRTSKQEGWLEKLVEIFWSYDNWTLEMCQAEAQKYTDMQDFYTHSRIAYKVAKKNQWLDDICSHMPSSERYWTYEKLKEEVKKYNNKTEFVQGNEAAYRSALHKGLLDDLCQDMTPLRRKQFTKEECMQAAKQFESIVDFMKAYPSMYNASWKNGWSDEVCAHMHHRTRIWTYDMLVEEAKKYKHKIDFLKASPGAYSAASKKGILNSICSHMDDLGDMYNRAIYAWEFPDNTVYVGLTYNLEKREMQHLTNPDSPVYKYREESGLTPICVVKYDYVFVKEAKRLEGQVLSEYVHNGWKKLNSIKTGGLGSVKPIWNAEKIEMLAKKCKTREEFRTTYPPAYSACSKKKLMYILDKYFPKAERTDKNGKILISHNRKWTDLKIWNEVKKYSSEMELKKKNRKAYLAAERWGLLVQIKTYFDTRTE